MPVTPDDSGRSRAEDVGPPPILVCGPRDADGLIAYVGDQPVEQHPLSSMSPDTCFGASLGSAGDVMGASLTLLPPFFPTSLNDQRDGRVQPVLLTRLAKQLEVGGVFEREVAKGLLSGLHLGSLHQGPPLKGLVLALDAWWSC